MHWRVFFVVQSKVFCGILEKQYVLTVIRNHFYNILRFFDVLPNFPFTTSETMRDYYL